jgi:hypothetical protein
MIANLPTYQAMYPAIFHEPKRALFQARSKHKLGLSPLTTRARQHKSGDWLLKSKSGHGKSQVLAKASR